jgi:hypothetical protein
MVQVPDVPKSKELCKEICRGYEARLKDYFLDKEIQVNICSIKEDEKKVKTIDRVYKGTPDECNNSVYYTYLYHKQYHPCMISTTVPRNIPLKLARGVRIILTFLSRSDKQIVVKDALSSKDFAKRFNVLSKIDLDLISDKALEEKNLDRYTYYKKVSFQLGQMMGLLDGAEIYDKISLMQCYDTPIYSSCSLNEMKELFCEKLLAANLDWDTIKE